MESVRERSLLNKNEMLNKVHANHKMVIEQHLASGTADKGRLWLAVGYFYHGSGQYLDRSFLSEGQWEQLLKDTGRK